MRIAQIVTLVTPDGAFGGPVRVAINQSKELIRRGHDVTIFAGALGFETVPASLEGVPAELFALRRVVPRAGFSGLVSFELYRTLRRSLNEFDVVHVHAGRDLVTLPLAHLAGIRGSKLILQTHGMIGPTSNFAAPFIDRIVTRPSIQRSTAVLALTPAEASYLSDLGGTKANVFMIRNGSPKPRKTERPEPKKNPRIEVLFLARLHPRKRAAQFAEVAVELVDDLPHVRFTIAGPDEGDLNNVKAILARKASPRIVIEGAVSPSLSQARIASADVYVLPSVGEIVPMSVIEAMQVGVPVIITNDNGLSAEIRSSGSGVVTDGTLEGLKLAVRRLATDPELRREMGSNAEAYATTNYGIRQVVDSLIEIYG